MQLTTISELAEQIGCPRHRITYALRVRGIEPERRIGSTDVYGEAAVELVLQALELTVSDRVNPPEIYS